jgi:hypothetical protein
MRFGGAMSLSLADKQAVNGLAGVFYNFLPASFNNTTPFPIAAQRVGVSECWELTGSKGPAVTQLLTKVLENHRSRFCPLFTQIVELGMAYRTRKDNPITRQEIDRVNALLRQLDFKIPELNDPRFLSSFPSSSAKIEEPNDGSPSTKPSGQSKPDPKITSDLRSQLLNLATFEPQKRGYTFEVFLNQLFKAHNLAPRESAINASS